jgi:hypothetical protein
MRAATDVMSALKTAKATVEGLDGVFKLLTREHGEVAALIDRVTLSADPELRRQIFPVIREKLLGHEKGELSVVYPAYLPDAELAGYAEMHDRDAGTLERYVERLAGMAYDDRQWEETFAELAAVVARHAKLEEQEYFPQANRVFGKEVAREMEGRYEAARDEVVRGLRAAK